MEQRIGPRSSDPKASGPGVSLVLTVGAGLLLKSFGNLMSVDLGFQPSM